MDKTKCPICGKTKKTWFPLCWECTEKEKQQPKCEVCNVVVPEGHTLCKTHWLERNEEKKKIKSIEYVKAKKETEYREKFEGKYYFNNYMVKSKSEMLICYFLQTNGLIFLYEQKLTLDKEYRPDFVIDDQKGNTIIIEHFGMNDEHYTKKRSDKEKEYKKLCSEEKTFHFISTEEEDMFNLKERLGKKLNGTPLKRALWK